MRWNVPDPISILAIYLIFFHHCEFNYLKECKVDMTHILYQGETLLPFPMVLAFHLVLGKFLTYSSTC